MTFKEKVLKICPDTMCIKFTDSRGDLFWCFSNDSQWNELLETGCGISEVSANDAWKKTYEKMNNIMIRMLAE